MKTLVVLLISFFCFSSLYGADKGKRKNGWEEYGVVGKVQSMTEQTFDAWEVDDAGVLIGTVKGSDFLHFEFTKRGKSKELQRDFTQGGYDIKRRKIIEYDRNGKVRYIIKKVKDTPSWEFYKYYDTDKNFVKTREVFTKEGRMRYVMRDQSDGSESIGDTFYNDQNRMVRQLFIFLGRGQLERHFEYLRVDENGNWLEAMVVYVRNGRRSEELRVRTYTYY